MDARRKFGNDGEQLAAKFLEDRGYQILHRQWKHPIGEIDLVAKLRDEIVFVEVKARASDMFGHPEEAVHAQKLHKLQMLAEAFCAQKNWNGKYRIDVIAITMKTPPEIRHIIAVS